MRRTPVPNGGELVTVYQAPTSGEEVPVVSYLKDTLGDDDPDNDRIIDVWILNQKRQSWPKHLLAAVPFFYTRLPSKPPAPGKVPRPAMDLTKPLDHTVSGLFQQFLQVTALDPLGMPYRAATRSYRLNRNQHRDLRLAEAASALAPLTDDADIRTVRSRLILSSRLLGGLVSDRNLDLVNEMEAIRSEEMRGRNWELLRQQAERNNLFFEPLQLAGGPASHALLTVAKEDLLKPGPKPEFHGRFLGISSPWNDSGLVRRHPGQDRIPLALYSLEHPKAPFLLADMRAPLAPRRREIVRRAANDTAVGLLGFSRFANVEYFAATWVWNFIGNRRGAPNNRAWRIRSYATLRQKLNADTTLNPALREDLKRRVAKLSMNPLEEQLAIDNQIARVQHASLQKYAQNPKGLALRLEQSRRREASMFTRGTKKRAAVEFARWLSFGLYQGNSRTDAVMLAEIARRRKVEVYAHRLENMLDEGPVPSPSTGAGSPVWQLARDLDALAGYEPAVRELMLRLHTAAQPVTLNAPALNENTPVVAAPEIENEFN